MNDKRGDLITGCVLYTNTNSAGLEYLAGNWGMCRVFIFPVREPRPDGPTHRLVFGERPDDRDKPQAQAPQERPPVSDKDLPF